MYFPLLLRCHATAALTSSTRVGLRLTALAAEALTEPARGEGVTIVPAAMRHIVDYTEGYPYFIQEYGRAVWNTADGPTITLADARAARDLVEAELDESFFRARVQRATPEELRYMRAMAELGPDAQKASDVAEVLHRTSEQIAPLRARLINKGHLYGPPIRPVHAPLHDHGRAAAGVTIRIGRRVTAVRQVTVSGGHHAKLRLRSEQYVREARICWGCGGDCQLEKLTVISPTRARPHGLTSDMTCHPTFRFADATVSGGVEDCS